MSVRSISNLKAFQLLDKNRCCTLYNTDLVLNSTLTRSRGDHTSWEGWHGPVLEVTFPRLPVPARLHMFILYRHASLICTCSHEHNLENMYHGTSPPFVLVVQFVVLRAFTTVLQHSVVRYVGSYCTLVLSIE